MYRRVTFSKQVLLHSINFFRTATFWEKQILQKCNILHYLVCLESHFYRAATFSKDLTFHSCFLFQTSYFFRTYFYRRDTISQLYFFPQLHFLFISQQLCKLDTNYNKIVGVLSCVSIIAQSRIRDKVYLISSLHKVLQNCYFLSKLLFHRLFGPCFLKAAIPFLQKLRFQKMFFKTANF